MDLQHIPRTFWHSLSIAVVVISVGLTYIAYRSSSVSIELANAKINLSSEVASSTIALNAALEEAKQAKQAADSKYQALLLRYQRLETHLDSIEETTRDNPSVQHSLQQFKAAIAEDDTDTTPPQPSFKQFDQNILRAQQSLDKLEALNQQLQPLQ